MAIVTLLLLGHGKSRQLTLTKGKLVSASTYAWGITRGKIEGLNVYGVIGPEDAPLTFDQIKSHEKAEKFRLLYGDGEVYCYGHMVDLEGNASGFEPLDDFGTPGLGATEIQYYNKETRNYETL